jgi:uncharacterized OB-fold protein
MPEDTTSLRPRPVIDALSQPFWDGMAGGELVIQRCVDCGYYVHPPYPECTSCRGSTLTFEAVSGRGAIFERSIISSPVVVGFEDAIPYACVVVELEEQDELLVAGRFEGPDPSAAVVGTPVEAVFRAEPDGFQLVQFAPVSKVPG